MPTPPRPITLLVGALLGQATACGRADPRRSAPPPHRDGPSPASRTADEVPRVPDLDDGRYRNPVVGADYSDPDPIRVGDDYYLVSSSFNCTPGLPILHSRDLVHWSLVGHAIQQVPGDRFAQPQHGQGVWAPSIRAHAGTFYIAFPNYCRPPDDGPCIEEGIWVITAPHPSGPWSPPHQLLAERGVIDPSLFWDDDGRAYLVHAYARSRAGIGDRLDVRPMATDASAVLGPGQTVYTNPRRHPTLEGPKMYKRHGWYYILAPAGGVPTGWQVALRSRGIYGPYQDRIVLQQGRTSITGPHQGGLVDTPDGKQWWFVHFQDAGPLGRVVHLNPVTWQDDWPLMGEAGPSDIRQPVATFTRPALAQRLIGGPRTSDEFTGPDLGLQWQWQANHRDAWWSLSARPGVLRLYPQDVPAGDLVRAPNLLLQKIPAASFDVETSVALNATLGYSRAGLVLWGEPATALLVAEGAGFTTVLLTAGGRVLASETLRQPAGASVRLRMSVSGAASARFAYASAGVSGDAWRTLAPVVSVGVRKGSWIGVKVGLVALAPDRADRADLPGWADFDYFRFGRAGAPP